MPKDKAAAIAINTVVDFIKANKHTAIEEIIFVCFDEENYNFYLNQMPVVVTLYRPVNQAELNLIEETNIPAQCFIIESKTAHSVQSYSTLSSSVIVKI